MKLKLHWQIAIALVLGVAFGFLSRQLNFTDFVTNNLAVLGDLFKRGLQMIIVPLVVSSIITGVTSIGSGKSLGRMGAKTFAYYITTSLLAILTGLVLVNLFAPGVGAEVGLAATPEDLAENAQKIGDTLIGIIPTNPLASMVFSDMLPTIFFSLLFGFFILKSPEPHRGNLTNFFKGVFEVMMKMTQFIILFAPVGVFALIAKIIAQTGFDVVIPLATYMITVMSALVIHAMITLPLLLFFIGGISPLAHVRAMSAALLTAFSTASSGATLPLTLKSVEDNAGASNKTSSFVLPLGATINMDGTALYQGVAALFVAQAFGIDLSTGQYITIILTSTLASIGSAGVPGAGLIMLSLVLTSVGLPLEGLAVIAGIDRILDMARTTVNVTGDLMVSVIVAKSEGELDEEAYNKVAVV